MTASKTAVTLEEVLNLVKQLKLVDKVRLIERVAPQIERELAQTPVHRKSLGGLWRGIDISESDIAELRGQMWGQQDAVDWFESYLVKGSRTFLNRTIAQAGRPYHDGRGWMKGDRQEINLTPSKFYHFSSVN